MRTLHDQQEGESLSSLQVESQSTLRRKLQQLMLIVFTPSIYTWYAACVWLLLLARNLLLPTQAITPLYTVALSRIDHMAICVCRHTSS